MSDGKHARIGKRVLKNTAMLIIAASAFVAIFSSTPLPAHHRRRRGRGLIGHRIRPAVFEVIKGHHAGTEADHVEGSVADWLDANPPAHTRPSLARAVRVGVSCAVLWFAPIVALGVYLGRSHVFTEQAIFFSNAAVVTFGGAYAVLAWFALHVMFGEVTERMFGPVRLLVPTLATLDVLALVLSAGAFVALFRFERGMITTLVGCAVVGAVLRTLVG